MVIKLTASSMSGVAPLNPPGCVVKKPVSGELAKQNRLAIGDATPKNSCQRPGGCKLLGRGNLDAGTPHA